MGKLIKNHWARLIILTAAIYQCAAALEGFFWPKIFWDFLTKNLDAAVKPFPILQIINLLFGLFGLAWEWPLKPLAGTSLHRSIETRLVLYPLSALAAALLYQATNPAIYYCIGMGIYFWAFSEGEVCSLVLNTVSTTQKLTVLQCVCAETWTLPPSNSRSTSKV
jgi:hypothetical protein